jgi:hypothetical protein
MFRVKAFEKAEFSLKEDPKPRAISCFNDLYCVAFAPTIQWTAAQLAPCLAPGAYATLPHSPGWNVIWDKGMDPITHATLAPQPGNMYVYEEDGENWDLNHRVETLAAVRSLYVTVMPEAVAREYAQQAEQLHTVSYIPSSHGVDWKFEYSVTGTLNTGEPDTSFTNTLICSALDTFRRTFRPRSPGH